MPCAPSRIPSKVSYENELQKVCSRYKVNYEMAIAGRKHLACVYARAVVFKKFNRDGCSLPGIGRRANKNHSTVFHGIKNIGKIKRKLMKQRKVKQNGRLL